MPISPSDSEIHEFCNLGYATKCPHLPPDCDWDAVRFSVARTNDGQIVFSYACELGHAPIEHGTLTFDVSHERWLNPHADARVRRLADSYLHTYRTRKAQVIIE